MNEQQQRTLKRAEALVRSAGQNILDALGEIKAIKEGQPMQATAMPEEQRHNYHSRPTGPISPNRDRHQSNLPFRTKPISSISPELPDNGDRRKGRHGLKPSRPNGRTDRPRRHEPYKRQKGGW